MKVWIVCALLCATFTLKPDTAAAVETKPEQGHKLPGETTELAVEEVIEAGQYSDILVLLLSINTTVFVMLWESDTRLYLTPVNPCIFNKDKVEALKLDADAEEKYNPCPSRWVKYGSRCFRLMRTIQSWLNAEAECVAQKSRLASVHNIREYNFLQSLLDIAGVTQAWIGAYHFQGVWLWFDTSELSYTNWQSLSSVSNYTCAYMRKNAGWYNTNCETEYSFLCAIDLKAC